MHSLKIVLLCIAAAIIYGIIHDQITARVCVEYFTIGHPPIFGTEDPTLLGLGWGIVATWWVGALLGIPLSIAAQHGPRPPRNFRSLILPIGVLLLLMACCALCFGFLGWILARSEAIVLLSPLRELVPTDRQTAFLADLWAHSASYAVGFLGGIILIIQVWRSRRNLVRSKDSSTAPLV